VAGRVPGDRKGRSVAGPPGPGEEQGDHRIVTAHERVPGTGLEPDGEAEVGHSGLWMHVVSLGRQAGVRVAPRASDRGSWHHHPR
jgi:hypothetical protein